MMAETEGPIIKRDFLKPFVYSLSLVQSNQTTINTILLHFKTDETLAASPFRKHSISEVDYHRKNQRRSTFQRPRVPILCSARANFKASILQQASKQRRVDFDEAVDDVIPIALAQKLRQRLAEDKAETSTAREDAEKRKPRGKKVDHLYCRQTPTEFISCILCI